MQWFLEITPPSCAQCVFVCQNIWWQIYICRPLIHFAMIGFMHKHTVSCHMTGKKTRTLDFLVVGFGRQPFSTRLVRRPAMYTATQSLAVGSGAAVGLIVRIETLLAIVCHRIFIIIMVEYRLGLLGSEMYHGFKRLLNHTDTSFAHLKR